MTRTHTSPHIHTRQQHPAHHADAEEGLVPEFLKGGAEKEREEAWKKEKGEEVEEEEDDDEDPGGAVEGKGRGGEEEEEGKEVYLGKRGGQEWRERNPRLPPLG